MHLGNRFVLGLGKLMRCIIISLHGVYILIFRKCHVSNPFGKGVLWSQGEHNPGILILL